MNDDIIVARRPRIKSSNKAVYIIALVAALVLVTFPLASYLPVHGEGRIYSDIIRLHILANSDSAEDQSLKLELRDHMLTVISALTEGCATTAEASEKISLNIEALQDEATDFAASRGYDYKVTAALGREKYPERRYTSDEDGDFIFPSGTYNSLRFFIGEGAGKNWWCVLFPPICLSGSKVEDELATAGYSGEQIKILKGSKSKKYEIRFKILEFFSDLFD